MLMYVALLRMKKLTFVHNRVIYDAINDVESAMRGMLAPQFKEVVVGRAEVRQVISTPKAIVAGSYVTEGRITNDSEVRFDP